MSRPPRALARRDARALLYVASQGDGQGVLALRDELRAFAQQLDDHPPLRRALAHPTLAAERKRRLVLALADAAKATPLLKRLLELLSSRVRLSLLPPEVVKSPVLTALYERMLKGIEQGTAELDAFIARQEAFIRDM